MADSNLEAVAAARAALEQASSIAEIEAALARCNKGPRKISFVAAMQEQSTDHGALLNRFARQHARTYHRAEVLNFLTAPAFVQAVTRVLEAT